MKRYVPIGISGTGTISITLIETQKTASVSRSSVAASVGKGAVTGDFEISNASGEMVQLNTQRSKLDCPKFEGYDFLDWKLKVEQYFEAVKLVEEHKVLTAMIHLKGRALQWHQRFMKSYGSLKKVS